ncbi:transglutaminase TgpA family protein [Deinococcus peraridilitoris]|uniref:Transglutaminase-like enzyme, predicted cysteine protease n=1 Tax=Deinococcus peraridilitoris (strain DSM 19664 / LMG 22246 / CIP 109416 / KR-200) TaxID=937777 RepID=L0A0N5_DEIPD|nr:DUF3488 and transglutaminase-like domain-containing protein [Deinococcus peraridilitoris]AFZ66565.1 transglutaminase-like enzyme, predicted cysteine protease [Deinococcus peraridilitoris DSM 19664]
MKGATVPPAPLPVTALYVTVAAFALTALPTLLRVPFWQGLLLGLLLSWRLAITRWGWHVPWTPLLLALVVVSTWGIAREYGTLIGRDGGTAVLITLVAFKLLEIRTRRDARVVLVLGYFVTASHFFFAQDTLTALHALSATFALTLALLVWQVPTARHSGTQLRRLARQSARLLGQAAPLTLALFVLFPRPDGPLWQMPVVSRQATTGLSDEVTPGSVSSLAQDDAVAFRAQFAAQPPAPGELYWRAYVHETFDGRSWRRSRPQSGRPTVYALSPTIAYSLTLEPNGRPQVFTLDVPTSLPPHSAIDADLQASLESPVATRTRLGLNAVTAYRYGLDASSEQLERNLYVPEGGNPQTRLLAGRWATLPPAKRVQAALELFRTGGYQYTLDPPGLPAQNPMDALLFGTRRGFCEHYAGAFAYLMRLSGVPARLVTGYQGGQNNGNYLIVRQANAHAWTEVWLDGEGWQRIDPTAALAPARLTGGLAAALPARQLPALLQAQPHWLSRLNLKLDAVHHAWNEWVIGYDGVRQRALLARLGIGAPGSAGYLLLLLGLSCAGLAAAFLTRRARRVPLPQLERAFQLLCAKLRLTRHPSETLSAYTVRATRLYPDDAAELRALVSEYQRLKYGPGTDTGQLYEFQLRIRRLRLTRRAQA